MKPLSNMHHRLACLSLAALGGCFDPLDPVADTETSTGGSSTSTPATTTAPDPDEGSSSSTPPPGTTSDPTATSDPTDGPTTDPSTTDGPPPACGDGNPDPGELCLPDTPTTFAAGAGARYVKAGMLGATPGVVTANTNSYTITILTGDGIGGFAAPVSKSVGNSNDGGPVSVGLGDLEPDGDVDIVAHAPQETRWFLDNGAGQFPGNGSAVIDGTIFATASLVVDNFDGNSALDVAYSDGYNICFMLGNVDFNGVYSMGQGGNCNSSIQVFEDGFVAATEYGFDGDGFRDLVVAASWGPFLTAVRGNGNGTFMTTGAASNGFDVCAPASCQLSTVNAADLDGDGEIELLASHDQGISIAPGNGDGSFGMPYALPVDDAYEMVPVDLDLDGSMDLVVASRGGQALVVLRGHGDGTFEDPLVLLVGEDVVSVDVADFDANGALDLVTTYGNAASGTVAVFLADP
jgi:hypothetical protein